MYSPLSLFYLLFFSKNTDSVSVTSEKSIAAVSSHGSVADLDNSTEEEKPQRSTRTKTRKRKTESVSKTRTKTRKKHQSSQLSSTDYSDDEVMLISDGEDTKSESNQRLSASITDDDCAFASEVKTTRTRTKQKNNSNKLTLSMIMRTLVSLVLSPCQRQTYRGQGQKWDIELVTVKTPNLNQIKD